MPGSGPYVIFCPAGVNTRVLEFKFNFASWEGRFDHPNIRVEWERYSSLPPFYTSGGHSSSETFNAVTAGSYCAFYFKPSADVTVTFK